MVGGELKGGRYGEMVCGEVFRRDNILGGWLLGVGRQRNSLAV